MGAHEPGLHQLRVHAGAPAHGRRLGCVRPHSTPGRRLQPAARRLRRLPRSRRPGRPRLHAGVGRHRHPRHDPRPGSVAGARRVHDAAGDTGRDAAGDELLPDHGRPASRRSAPRGPRARPGHHGDDFSP